jgi:hypothetical protein
MKNRGETAEQRKARVRRVSRQIEDYLRNLAQTTRQNEPTLSN